MLHEKFYLNLISKSQITSANAIFFNKAMGTFLVAKSGIKNNSLQPVVITANGTIPENGEYSDGFVESTDQLGEYVELMNSSNSDLNGDLLYVIDNGKGSLLVDFSNANGVDTKSGGLIQSIDLASGSDYSVTNEIVITPKSKVGTKLDVVPNDFIKEVIDEKPKAETKLKTKVVKTAVAIGTIANLSKLEETVLAKCMDVAGEGAMNANHTGFSFRVCEGNLSMAGAFSTLQRKGYIETFVDKLDKRKEKFFRIIRDKDGKLL